MQHSKAHMKFMQNLKCDLVGPLPYQNFNKSGQAVWPHCI